MLLVNYDQSEPWKSDLRIILSNYHNSMAKSTLLMDLKLYKWPVMGIFPWGNCALLWQWIITLEGAGTPRKKWPVCLGFAWLTLKSREWSSVPGWNRLHLVILWHEILILITYVPVICVLKHQLSLMPLSQFLFLKMDKLPKLLKCLF